VKAILGSESAHAQLFWEYGDQLAIRQGEWQLVLNGRLDFDRADGINCVHLSNLLQDPGERTNLASQYPELLIQMKAVLERWSDSMAMTELDVAEL
jgi:hypothetical protein